MSGTELIMGMEEVVQHIQELEKRKKELEEENKKLKYDLSVINDIAEERGSHMEALEEERFRLQSQNKQLQEEQLTAENAIQYVYENTDEYDEWVYGSTIYQELVEKNKNLEEELKQYKEAESFLMIQHNPEAFAEKIKELKLENNTLKEEIKELKRIYGWGQSDEEEEKCKYDGDDWSWGYGFTTKNGEYRINMCGGCENWFDYVIDKNGCFIHNKDGKEKVENFISCPEGNYVKVVRLGEKYEADEGETYMREMVAECFIDEIMNYEEEEDCIPQGSDEEDEEDEKEWCKMMAGFLPVKQGSYILHNLSEQRYTLGDRMRTTYKDKVADNSLMRRICVLDENDKMSKKHVIIANAFAIFTREGDDEMYYICRNDKSRGALQVRNIISNKKVDVPVPEEFLRDLQVASRPIPDDMTRVSALLKGGGCAMMDVEGNILMKDFPDWFKEKTGKEVDDFNFMVL